MGIRGFNREAASETGRHNQAEDKVRKEQVSLDTLGFGAAAETDGGAWRATAVETIKSYMVDNLDPAKAIIIA